MAIEIGLFPSKEEEEQLKREEAEARVKRTHQHGDRQFEVTRTSSDSVTVELECEQHAHEVYIVGRIEGDVGWGVGTRDRGYPLRDTSFVEAVEHCAVELSGECIALDADSAIAEVDMFFGGGPYPALKERLNALAGFVQALEAPDFEFGSMESPPGTMPYYILSEVASDFLQVCYDMDWVQPNFDWVEWKDSDEATRLRDDPSTLEYATTEQLERLLTVLIRQDRFVEGALGSAFDSGLLLRIVRRAGVLTRDVKCG